MKIALVSTIALTTPPEAYGGTELVVAELAKGLCDLGHEVVTYATGDSSPAGSLRSLHPHGVWPPDDLAELRHAAFAFRDMLGERFDVVHLHHPSAIPFSITAAAPCVATLHHERVPRLNEHYRAYPEVSFVAISKRQADLNPEIPFVRVIHHGLDTRLYAAGDGGGGYAAFLGRFTISKGTHVALDVAREAGVPLHLGGTAHQVEEAQAYFASEVRPRLAKMGSSAVWHGEVSHGPKVELLRGARALLFPIDRDEPFGLAMIESMLVGTPVIAFRRGSAPEIVEEGITGFVVDTVEEMTERLRRIETFDRARCRARGLERWSAHRMATEYAELYEDLAGSQTTRKRPSTSIGAADSANSSAR